MRRSWPDGLFGTGGVYLIPPDILVEATPENAAREQDRADLAVLCKIRP